MTVPDTRGRVVSIGGKWCRSKTGKPFMKRSSVKSILLASVMATLAGTAIAQDQTGQNAGTGSGQLSPAAAGVATATDALGLAAWARENDDAEAMLVAARMMASLGTLGTGAEP